MTPIHVDDLDANTYLLGFSCGAGEFHLQTASA